MAKRNEGYTLFKLDDKSIPLLIDKQLLNNNAVFGATRPRKQLF